MSNSTPQAYGTAPTPGTPGNTTPSAMGGAHVPYGQEMLTGILKADLGEKAEDVAEKLLKLGYARERDWGLNEREFHLTTIRGGLPDFAIQAASIVESVVEGLYMMERVTQAQRDKILGPSPVVEWVEKLDDAVDAPPFPSGDPKRGGIPTKSESMVDVIKVNIYPMESNLELK